MLSAGPTCPKRTTQPSVPTRSHAVSLVSVHVAQARRRTIQRRLKQGFGTVKVQDCVTARNIERQRTVELDSFVDNVRGHARVVGRQCRWLDHEPLVGGIDGRDGVRVVDCIEQEPARVAADFVGLVAARGSRAEWVWDRGVATVRALLLLLG